MTDWIAQLGLLAAGDDFSGWANILFIVIIMLFSVVGGLIKNSGAKKRQQQQSGGGVSRPLPTGRRQETWQQRLARKAEEMQRAFEARYEETQRSLHTPPGARPRPPQGGKLTVRAGRSGESVMVYEKDRPETVARQRAARERQAREAVAAARRLEAQRRLVSPSRRESSIPSAPPRVQEPAPVAMMAETLHESTDYPVAPPLISYDDPDALRRAILHYEILGKPLAFRDPFERTSGY